ncbi:hypothetical protein D3C80_1434310 [compost metagenome]
MRRTKRCLLNMALMLGIILIMSACGSDNGTSVKYKGVTYNGEGTTKTMVSVVIQNEDEVLFLQQIKIIDDSPTVWKALEAISKNEEQGLKIEKDAQGHISKINNQQNDEQRQWVLLIDNMQAEGNVEVMELGEDQNVTLSYEGK